MTDKRVCSESDARRQLADFSPVTLFRALSDELRLAAMLLIRDQQELCVCELTEAFAVSQPKVSRHLAILRETALVATERRGQWVYYSVNPGLPQWVFGVLDETARSNTALLESPLMKLQAMAERPAVSCP